MKDPTVVFDCAEKLGLGTRQCELIDVLPVQKIERAPLTFIPAR
jgi:hypothetical protein